MKKIRTAVIGAGYFGRYHAEKYAGLESAELKGVVDPDRKKAEELAGELGTDAYASHEELFDRVDAVSIVTPTETHKEIGLSFLSRGIDVLIEKPLTLTVEEADSLIKESEKTGAILQVGYLERFNPAVLALKGKLKNPLFIESDRLSPFPHRALDVCVVLDLMIHDIDIILNLVDSDVESVDSVGVPVISDKVDIASARVRFKNGCVANVTASRVSIKNQRKMRLFQPDAYISIDYTAQHISVIKLDAGKEGALPTIVPEELDIEKRDSLLEEIKSFLECCAERKQPFVTGRDGKRILEVAQMIQASTDRSMAKLKAHINI
jgi:predicted dehydrogenase